MNSDDYGGASSKLLYMGFPVFGLFLNRRPVCEVHSSGTKTRRGLGSKSKRSNVRTSRLWNRRNSK